MLALETPIVLSLYRSYKSILKPFAMANEQEKAEVPVDEMIAVLENLKEAMDSFDLDGADAAMHQLESFAFPETMQGKVEELSAYVADVAMQEVMDLVDVLVEELR
jgi:hypothetical protein